MGDHLSNKKYHFCLSGICFLTAFLIVMSGVRKQDEALASRIAPSILRFHVLADSDSSEDQAMKLEVKDFLLERIRTRKRGENTGKQELCQYLAEHRDDLEKAAGELIRSRGFSYGASIRLEICEFPARTYGDMTFPAGTYEAVRVLLWLKDRGKISGVFSTLPCVTLTASRPSCPGRSGKHPESPPSGGRLLRTFYCQEDDCKGRSGKGAERCSAPDGNPF